MTTAPTGLAPKDSSTERTRRIRLVASLLAVVAGLVLVSVPAWASSGLMRTLVEFFCLFALAQLWNLLAGYAGMVSVGQQAWIGLGGYSLIVFAQDLHVNMFVAAMLGGLVAGLVALPASWILFRLRVGYFAIGTWVVAEVIHLLVAGSTDWLQGGLGRTLTVAAAFERGRREDLTYWLALGVGIGAALLLHFVMRSPIGLGLTAIRDSEGAASSLGVPTERIKRIVYLICAVGTGVVGGVIYLNVLRITPPAAFSVQWSAFMIFIVVIGGIGTPEGPLLGTIVFFGIREYLSDFGPWSVILLGLVAILMMFAAPKGLRGLLERHLHLDLISVRRHLPAALIPPRGDAEGVTDPTAGGGQS